MQLTRAFLSTARRYAPVPVTFGHVVLGNYLPIVSTATGGTLIVVAFCRVAFQRFMHRQVDNGEMDEAASQADRENVLVGAVEAVAGLTLYSAGKSAWQQGPLRGGVSVFGASPELDRCASSERYLAEKMAEMSGAALGGVASLAHLSRLEVPDKDIEGSVGALVTYARRCLGLQTFMLAPEVGEAWQEFAVGVLAHRKDMRSIANKIMYPRVPGVGSGDAQAALMVVNATDPVMKVARSCRDSGSVLKTLLADLRRFRGSVLGPAVSAFTLGLAIGTEAGSAVLHFTANE